MKQAKGEFPHDAAYDRYTLGKKSSKVAGQAPSLILTNPKYDHNVGAALRACSCYGFKQLWWTGNRVRLDETKRLPREERMKGYMDVTMHQFDYPFDQFANNTTFVAIELAKGSQPLTTYQHPDNAVYVFGPEDGSIAQVSKRFCRDFVFIPTHHCLNLATAVATVLYDRRAKRQVLGAEPMLSMSDMLNEDRGF